jgi:Domain of unknown function (DUF4037)
MFTADEVYHDDVGLQPVRDRLAYYPRDVWLYLLIAGWWRVHPEVNVVGRAGSVGDGRTTSAPTKSPTKWGRLQRSAETHETRAPRACSSEALVRPAETQ